MVHFNIELSHLCDIGIRNARHKIKTFRKFNSWRQDEGTDEGTRKGSVKEAENRREFGALQRDTTTLMK